MRKSLFILLPLIVLVVAFFAYFRMQPHFSISSESKTSTEHFESPGSNSQFIQPGKSAWVKQYDKQGQLYCQFKSDYYEPQPDGNVKVTHPVIQFYLSAGQILQIEGKEGTIRFNPDTDKTVMSNSPNDPPRDGTLRTVTVKLFSSAARLDSGDPQMTMMMTNAQFDNDTYRLFTQDYVNDAGQTVHADQIPVQISAKDYAFDGTGLVMYWNDVDKRLKSLEIAHGHELVIYNGAGFAAQTGAPTAPQNSPEAVPQQSTAQQSAPAPSADQTPPPANPGAPRRRYLATFYDNVHVVQTAEQIRADKMEVDFAAKEQQNNPAESSGTETNSAAGNSAASNPVPASSANSSTPATQPTSEPVHVFWTGKMRMVPNDDDATPLADGKAIVRFLGGPVRLHQTAADAKQSVDVQCNNLQFNTADSNAHLTGELVLKQTRADGVASVVSGETMDFSRMNHEARFTGPGHALLPDPNDPKTILATAWQKSCVVHLYDLDKGQMQIDAADLSGDVVVKHPKFDMTARDDVKLRFDILTAAEAGKSSSPPLREIDAIGNADCKVHEADQKVREISGQSLQLFRDPDANGKLYAKTIICSGSVFAQQDDQNLSAEHLRIGLLPAQPKAEQTDSDASEPDTDVALDTMDATTNVKASGKDASSVSGDELHVKMVDGHARVTLMGAPGQNAVLKGKNSTLTGPVIHFSPHDQTASIIGAGTFDGVQEPKNPGEKPRPMKMTWQQGATLDGNVNKVVVIGNVRANSDAPDGTHDSARSDRIVAILVDTKPATQPAKEDDSDFMKNKQVQSLTLMANDANLPAIPGPDAEVQTYQTDAKDNLLHQYDLQSRRIDYDVADRRVTVNGAGRILAIELGAPTTQPAAQPAGGAGNADTSGRGNTAIKWKRKFIFDDASHSAVIEGEVEIVHQTFGKQAQSVQVDGADIVQADFVAEGEKLDTPDKHIKSVSATGAMVVKTSDQKTIHCGEIDFDPVQQTMTCRGGEGVMVTVVDDANIDNNGSFADVTLDTKTNNLIKLTDVTAHEHQNGINTFPADGGR